MTITLRTLKRGLLLFWAVWFSLVVFTNVLDALKELGALPAGWTYASGNFRLVLSVVQLQRRPTWVAGALFASVVPWEGVCALLFWRAAARFQGVPSGLAPVTTAFAASIALWAAFSLAVEAFIAFEKISEGVFQTLLGLNLLSLMAVCLLPDD